MTYFHWKALHLIFVVSWFAGLFYLPRLLIYQVEAQARPPTERAALTEQLGLMARRLFWAITTPAMVLALVTGVGMLVQNPALLRAGWIHLKLLMVVALLGYHWGCYALMRRTASGRGWSSLGLRLWNEVATVLLVAIVFLAVLKNSVDWVWGLLGIALFAAGLMAAVRLIKALRRA